MPASAPLHGPVTVATPAPGSARDLSPSGQDLGVQTCSRQPGPTCAAVHRVGLLALPAVHLLLHLPNAEQKNGEARAGAQCGSRGKRTVADDQAHGREDDGRCRPHEADDADSRPVPVQAEPQRRGRR